MTVADRVGPILFANERAREQFLSGKVVTFRRGEERRTTGDTHARWKRTGKAKADARVEHLARVDPRDDSALISYVGPSADPHSGFANIPMWRNAMVEENGELPDVGHLYRVKFVGPRPALESEYRGNQQTAVE